MGASAGYSFLFAMGDSPFTFEVAQREFQPTKIRVVVVANREGDVDGVAGEER